MFEILKEISSMYIVCIFKDRGKNRFIFLCNSPTLSIEFDPFVKGASYESHLRICGANLK